MKYTRRGILGLLIAAPPALALAELECSTRTIFDMGRNRRISTDLGRLAHLDADTLMGILTPAQADAFLRLIMDESALLPDAKVTPMHPGSLKFRDDVIKISYSDWPPRKVLA